MGRSFQALMLPAMTLHAMIVRTLMIGTLFSLLLPAPVLAQQNPSPNPVESGAGQSDPITETSQLGAQERLDAAIVVLREMESDRDLAALLQRARGVFIVPEYGEAALIIGAGGGDGVLLLREGEQWGNPAFYRIGSLSAGLQAGVIAGSLALILVSERATSSFYGAHSFSLSLEAGLVVVDRSTWARGDADRDLDVVLWSDTEGLLAELAVGMNSILWQPTVNQEYYGRLASPEDILSGEVINPYHHELQQALREPN